MLKAASKELRVGGRGKTLVNTSLQHELQRTSSQTHLRNSISATVRHQKGIRTCNKKDNVYNPSSDIRFEVVNNCVVYLIPKVNTQVDEPLPSSLMCTMNTWLLPPKGREGGEDPVIECLVEHKASNQ